MSSTKIVSGLCRQRREGGVAAMQS